MLMSDTNYKPDPPTLALLLLGPRDSFPTGAWNSSRSNSVCKEHLLLKSNSPDSCLAPAVADGVGAEEEVVAHILASHLQMSDSSSYKFNKVVFFNGPPEKMSKCLIT